MKGESKGSPAKLGHTTWGRVVSGVPAGRACVTVRRTNPVYGAWTLTRPDAFVVETVVRDVHALMRPLKLVLPYVCMADLANEIRRGAVMDETVACESEQDTSAAIKSNRSTIGKYRRTLHTHGQSRRMRHPWPCVDIVLTSNTGRNPRKTFVGYTQRCR